METTVLAASPFVLLVAWSAVLLIVHIAIQGATATQEVGLDYNASARDEAREPKGKLAGRAARSSKNFQETYPAFVGLALALALASDPSGWGLAGAWIWLLARLVYIPLYLAGIPYVRSIAWVVSLVGLLVMASVLIF